ncbi:MAG: hypothetical protein AAF667_10230 [Pseudomonadota bacterium]
MTPIDIAGVLAGIFVILAFYARDQVWLRRFAITSNLLFVYYGWQMQLWPILALHLILLPLNGMRLWEIGAPVCGEDPRDLSDLRRDQLAQEMRMSMNVWMYRRVMG